MKIIYYNNFEKILKETKSKNRIIVSSLQNIKSMEDVIVKPNGSQFRLSWVNPSCIIIEEFPSYDIFMECICRSYRTNCIFYINPLKMKFEFFNYINSLQNE